MVANMITIGGYIIVNFRAHEISQGARKLTRISTVLKYWHNKIDRIIYWHNNKRCMKDKIERRKKKRDRDTKALIITLTLSS